jgi:transcriptional regulator with XRE-family HTH domain
MRKIAELSRAFGRVIAEERTRQKLSQEQLAEAIGSNNVYICLLENGQRQPSLNAAILLAASLKLTPAELIERVSGLLDKPK